jgi:hypothetical protein
MIRGLFAILTTVSLAALLCSGAPAGFQSQGWTTPRLTFGSYTSSAEVLRMMRRLLRNTRWRHN